MSELVLTSCGPPTGPTMSDSRNFDDGADAQSALAAVLRTQMMDRVRAQEQLVVASAAIGGAAASFGSDFLAQHSEVVAFLAVLFATLLLAMLRQDQEITNIAAHLEDESAFGAHAAAQCRWERHKFLAMQRSGPRNTAITVTQVIGIYGIPCLAYLACGAAAISTEGREWETAAILGGSVVLIMIFALGSYDVIDRYQQLGAPAPSRNQPTSSP